MTPVLLAFAVVVLAVALFGIVSSGNRHTLYGCLAVALVTNVVIASLL